MQNDKSKRIQQLRNDAFDENRTPKDRIKSADRLLSEFGPTDRNLSAIRKVISTFIKDANYDTQERAQKLKAKLLKARDLKGIVEVEIPEEEAPAAPTEIVAGTSASEVPKAAFSISLNEVVAAHHEVLGGFKWRQLNEGTIELSEEEKVRLLEAILGGAPNVANVQNLFEALHVKNSFGWTIAGSCPEIVRIAQEFLDQKGVTVEPPQSRLETQSLLDALNNRSGVSL